jgi:tRNA (adenine37-N6)-methyltransferase
MIVIEQTPIGYVEAIRPHAEDDFWGGERSCIALVEGYGADALQGLSDFSHVEILYYFHEVEESKIVTGARHPRDNPNWPKVGIFAQRGKNRPNRLGTTISRVLRIEETRLYLSELDAIDKTPVLDIKPVMTEFLPREPVRQPAWSHELMRQYWLARP